MLLIYLPQHTSRSKYIFDKIFAEEFGILYDTTSDRSRFERYPEEKINYSEKKFSDEIFIKATALLFESTIHKTELQITEKNSVKVLFTNDSSCDMGFDIFAAAFYMLTRYEEYLPFSPDKYGRFDAKDSIAYKNDFLQIPVVDQWIRLLKSILQKKFEDLLFKPSQFKAIVTYDIDVAYKFKGRNWTRTAGSILKDIISLNLRNLHERYDVLRRKKNDPWDIYEYLKVNILNNNLQSIFFFLLSNLSKHDRNLNYKNRLMQQLVKEITSFSEIGIHPSFYTSSSFEKIILEKRRLEKLSGKPVTKSRQHFLKFTLPDTYNYLLKAGIREDYSMGFPDRPGFRAGTCKPFYFHDLRNGCTTSLKIFPVTCMEATFIYYTQLSPEASLTQILNLLKETHENRGLFISIWHNENLRDIGSNKGWRLIHDDMISQIQSFLKK